MAVELIEVELPDGTIIEDVPADMSKAELISKLKKNGFDISGLEDGGLSSDAVAGLIGKPLQGATFGGSDELQALMFGGINTAAKKIAGAFSDDPRFDTTFSDEFSNELASVRGALDAATKEAPVTSTLLEVGGGLTSGAGAAKAFATKAPAAANALATFAKANPFKAGAITSGVVGGVEGFNKGEGGLENRLTNARDLAAVSTLLSPVGVKAGQIIGDVGEKVKTKFVKAQEKFAKKALKSPKSKAGIIDDVIEDVDADEFGADLVKTKPGERFSKTAGQRSQDPQIQRRENNARAGLLTKEAEANIRQADIIQNRQFKTAINDLAGKKLDKGTDINALVDNVGGVIQRASKAKKKVVDSAYDIARKGQGVNIDADEIRGGLWSNISSIRRDGGYDVNQMPKAKAIIKSMARLSKKTKAAKIKSVKLGAMENWRKQVTNAIESSNDRTEKRFLGQMRSQYDDFMERTAADAVDLGDANAIKAFRAAVKERREFGQLFEKNKLVKDLVEGKKSLDDTVKDLFGTGAIKGKRNMNDNLKAVIKAAGDEGGKVRDDLRQAFLHNVFKKSIIGLEPGSSELERLGAGKLRTQLENLFVDQSKFAETLYGKEAVKAAKGMIEELRIISTVQSNVANASGSGELVGRLFKSRLTDKIPGLSLIGKGIDAHIEQSGAAKVAGGLTEFFSVPQGRSTLWATGGAVATPIVAEEAGVKKEAQEIIKTTN